MATALGAAELFLGKVLTKLSDGRVASYVASPELGLDSHQISHDLTSTHALLQQQAQRREVSHDPGVNALLIKLCEKAGEADDALNELQYFMIQDHLDGTQLVKPDLGGDPKVNKGNCLPCFSHPSTSSPQHGSKSDSGDHVEKLTFDSASMSIRIKSLIQEIHSICIPVSDLLGIPNHASSTVTATTVIPKRPIVGSTIAHDRLYGRSAIFEKTIGVITGCSETLSVLPVLGPGGIGKTTFVRHLYNDERIQRHFDLMLWVCVSDDFDVLKLTQKILECIPPTKEERVSNSSTNLDQLQISIARILESKRFLVVLDDLWNDNSDMWNTLLAPFAKGETKGNVVLVTTRILEIAQMVQTVDPTVLQGLGSEDFLTFFETCIFGDLNKPEHYGDQLIGVARSIAEKLNGSPLAAKTVGRLLRN